MKGRSKRYKKDISLFDKSKTYSVENAVDILKKLSSTKFNPTVELHFWLNIDTQKGDQNVRGSCSLPHGIGKERKVLVFADGEEADLAKKNGADFVGLDDFAEKISKGWLGFDIALAIPRSMKVISKLGKVLGPRGLMPTPKNGTLTEDIAYAVKEFKKGRIEFKNDKNGNLHVPVGKFDFDKNKMVENINILLEYVKTLRPSSVKGYFVRRAFICHTMSTSIELNIAPC
ncbi:MAG: 50S ribosomal protein L1 [Planctomycetes bacterium]|nr:50S ribosomal protein L1 [Planctomycetota bacterium]